MTGTSNRVKVETRGDITVIVFKEDILDDAEDLECVVRHILESGRLKIAFDMSGIRYLSARVLGVIGDSVRKARLGRGEVKLICPDSRLRHLLEKMGFSHAVEIVSSSDDAIDDSPGGIALPEKLMLWKDQEVYARA